MLYTAAPVADIEIGPTEVKDVIAKILGALQVDARVIAPVVSYDEERGRIDALFQIEGPVGEEQWGYGGVESATETACEVFVDALQDAGCGRLVGIAIVAGHDATRLP
jgi:hypothetical protein